MISSDSPGLTPTPAEAAAKIYQTKKGELPPRAPKGSKKTLTADTTYLSFGDEGTTATITEWGQHMQISRYLGNGSPALYTMDHGELSEPALGAQRRLDLLDMAEYRFGFGADLEVDSDSVLQSEITTSWLRNRWPRVVIQEEKKWNLVQQWVVCNGVVIQQLVLQNLQDEDLKIECPVRLNILIRDTNFVDTTREFNKEGDDKHEEGSGPGGYGFVKIHALSQGQENTNEHSDAVAAVIGLFINGDAITKDEFEVGITRRIPKHGQFQLVCGYKLVFLPHDNLDWERLVLNSQDVDIDTFLSKTQYENNIPENYFLFDREYFIGRNVEHILSVCMIPTTDHSEAGQDEATKENDIIALTCGDMSSHRVCVSASFFAFKFLLGVARELDHGHPLRDRIKKRCLAHLRWVFQVSQRPTDGKFARNYWVNGVLMSDSPQLLPDSPTDTPFQLLKAYEFWNFTSEEPESRAVLQDLLGRKEDNVGVQWLTALDGENKRGFFAWPHGHRSGIDYFRLDDHVWIWNAIRAVAAMNSLKATSTKSPLPKWEIEWKNLMRAYEPGRVKREIIQRFTTINDPAKQRMLAVTRSSRETRFAFHSRDTALFYEINGERMLDGSDPRWYSAMEIQRHFFSNLEWGETENPLYHGLNILMALRGVPLYGVDADKLFQRSKETLENSIPINGLIPDQLDGAGADEGPPYHRDSLLHIPFETLYLLSGPGKKGSPPSAQELESHKPEDGIQDSAAQRLERTVPFNDKIDEKNIINVKEEWLYNYPDFLDFDPSDSIEEQLTEEVEWNESLLVLGKEIQDSWPYISLFHIFQDLVLEAIFYWWDARKPDDWEYKPTSPPSSECQHLMIDVQKKKSRDKKALRLDTRVFQSNEIDDSWGRLKKLRDINNAKKRLLWFLNAPRDYALMCYLGSSPSERQQIRTFFNRHVNYVIFVEDKTNRVRNLWETEFHCGFLQLIKKGDHSLPPATCEMLRPAMDKLPELDEFKLVRAAVSFRFCGDFFDRFWTCHFIESYPGERPEGDIKAFFSRDNKRLEGLFSAGRDHVWQQRKILELLLFNRILAQINVSTRGITDMIREELATKNAVQSHGEEKKGLLGPYDTAVYFKTLKKWASLHEMLEVLDDELGRIWENVNAWQMREQDRRTEQPRWTNNDERKYRDALNAVFLLSQNAERELHGERSKVASFIKSLQYQSEEAKNNYDRHMTERSFQQNDNVKYFTYATVIFQPLAFAASIYSMQSSPPTEVLQHMVICSVVAFVVLLIIVISLPFFLRPNQLWHFFLQNLEPVLGGAEPVIWWFGAVAVAAEKGLFFKKGGFALLKYLWFVRQSSKPNVRRSDVESGLKNGQSKATVSFRQAVTTFEAQAPLNGTVDWWHTEAPDGNSGLGALTRISP